MTGQGADPRASLPVDESDLQAWIDGRLSPERQRIVTAWLAAHPEQDVRVRIMRQERELLRIGLASIAKEPIPARLRVDRLIAAQRHGRRMALRRTAYIFSSLAAGTAFGWFGRDMLNWTYGNPATGRVLAEAVAAHRVFVPDVRRPVEVAAAQEAQLVQWLSNRLGRRLPAPDLISLGLRLVGGRLLPGAAGEPAAQLMYQDERGERVTLYLRADPGEQETAFRFTQDPVSGIAAFWWVDGGFGYAVAAKTDRAELLRVAEAVYRQLDRS